MKFSKGNIRILKDGIKAQGFIYIKDWTSLLVTECLEVSTRKNEVTIPKYIVEVMGTPFSFEIDEATLELHSVWPGKMPEPGT